jgi:hypothetical protein
VFSDYFNDNPIQFVAAQLHGHPLLCAKHSREIGAARVPVKGLKFQTEMVPLLVILGVQVFERD